MRGGTMSQPHSFAREFVRRLRREAHHDEFPAFDYTSPSEVSSLVTTARPWSFHLGTGASIYASALLPAILSAQSEVILVTCFWARSKTLDALREALETLARQRRRDAPRGRPLRIRICLSSVGLFQKLFHTGSRRGYLYPPSAWSSKLGLPDSSLLEAAGIELRVKSLFFLPFSVMHPKFVIIDRQRAFLPSCNVSWESWLVGCVEISGDAVSGLLLVYARIWEPRLASASGPAPADGTDDADAPTRAPGVANSDVEVVAALVGRSLPTLFLPSTHHRKPMFRPFPWQAGAHPPNTPLNVAMLQLFESASRHIYVQTPNLTCGAVILALVDAMSRGVDVEIVTNQSMMVIEQLLTAGTTTSRCVRRLIEHYERLRFPLSSSPRSGAGGEMFAQRRRRSSGTADAALAEQPLGSLSISYFHALRPGTLLRQSDDIEQQRPSEDMVHSHLKLTIVDGEFTVLGSGNMDRASWYTSQELGIVFHDAVLALSVRRSVDNVLLCRVYKIFDSSTSLRGL